MVLCLRKQAFFSKLKYFGPSKVTNPTIPEKKFKKFKNLNYFIKGKKEKKLSTTIIILLISNTPKIYT